MARRFAQRQARAAKRKTIWAGSADVAPLAVGSGISAILSSFTPDVAGMLAPTVVRTRGVFQVHPTAFSADLSYDGAYGLGIVSSEALVAGATAIPRPFDDDDWPGWLVHGYFIQRLEFLGAQSEHFLPDEKVIDSKAMRKMGPNEALVWMVESRVGAFTAHLHARVLFMMS